ncbi:AbrB family transcriptional regulator [Nocardioides sp. Kera G14]|uniref:AbrB family transcriptional regulator n=1 Tax=Nocardioides sp. Kera G14 TaxID=2884264 RepID=UPI001D0F83BA|nr:AbrB family transcriptional regulator [Nocardioides sp. Kera G14]UDY22314.1 AbrB family transcriptional regulator [Nocardioides sp. Kera G14]
MTLSANVRGYALILAVTVVTSVALAAVHVPSPVLFGGLVGGIVHALTSPVPLTLPPRVFRLSQAMVGVIIGAGISLSSLSAMGNDAVAIIAVTLGTVLISLGAGRILALRPDVTPVTGAFALIAGGASGVVAIARELGADDRVVTVVQYLRVLIVLITMPVVTALVFHPDHGIGSLDTSNPSDLGQSLAYVVLTLALGLLIARLVPITTSILLGPIVVGAILVSTDWFDAVSVPAVLQWLAYAFIGIQVGLRFTRASLASIARMLPVVTLIILGMIVATAAMGSLLAVLTPVDGLTAYLATTPGGLFAVLATAADSGSDVTYVMAVQLVRLLVILCLTPLLARVLSRRAA